MLQTRPSRAGDVPQLKGLWKLAFGDEERYIDHFFDGYYAPERVLVLEEEGAVRAMTAWFDMPLLAAGGGRWPSAYLYAVATHPDCRGRGLASRLLAEGGGWLAEQGFACLTTVPARPDLHAFFGQNGFQEGFALEREEWTARQTPPAPLVPVDGREYGRLREGRLAGTVHVAYAPPALDYQAGVCALSGGGLYRVGTDGCACVELAGDEAVVKELLVPDRERDGALAALARRYPAGRYQVRGPYTGRGARWDFAMVKWLVPEPEWNADGPAYLGLAFD